MSRLLVLDYGQGSQGESAWIDQLFGATGCELKKAAYDSANDDDCSEKCDAVLVVDDGHENGVAALHSALRMRRNAPDLPIAIIKPVSEKWQEPEAMARGIGQSITSAAVSNQVNMAQLREMFSRPEHTDFDMRISGDSILFEYQG